MELTLNGTRINPPAEISNWHGLLDWLEDQQVHPGHCISRVRLNGDLALHFRQPRLLACALDDMGVVEIECGELDDVIRENLSELQSELTLALQISQSIVQEFASKGENGTLVQLIQVLKSVHVLFKTLSRNIGWMGEADLMEDLEIAIAELNVVQEDLIQTSVFEILERDIAPVLESCHDAVEQTRARIG